MAIPLVLFRMRWMSAAASAGALVLLIVAALAAGGAEANGKLGGELAQLADRHPATPTQVIVRMAPGATAAEGRALVQDSGGHVISRDLPIINGFGAELTAADAERLAADPRVQAVSLNGLMDVKGRRGGHDRSDRRDRDYTPSKDCPAADATTVSLAGYPVSSPDEVADISTAAGLLAGAHQHSVTAHSAWEQTTGKGVGVAVIDTGIAGDLPDFRTSASDRGSRVVATANTNPCAREATDNYGHGTHVAGLIAGNGLNLRREDPRYGRYMGIAPEADLVSVKVSDEEGRTTVLDVIYGLQFAVDHKDDYNIRVANLSLSSTVAESYKTDPLDAAAEQAWLNGIVVVAAAGNEGSSSDAVDYAPANDPYVITAGAVDDQGTRQISDDRLASWSSRGVTQDGFRKPDVLAPGTGLVSTLAPRSDLQQLCGSCVTDYNYFRMGGTSMSAAVVSGVAALLLEEHPDWTPNQVKGALKSTLVNVAGAGGEVSVARALRATRLQANVGLTPNGLIIPQTGLIDYTRASFRRASFRLIGGSPLDAVWSRASFRCTCPSDLGVGGYEVDGTRASYRRASLRRTVDFSK
jgi:serine protease AprX